MIGAQLRAMYEALVEAPVPERILALLNQLDSDQGCGDDR